MIAYILLALFISWLVYKFLPKDFSPELVGVDCFIPDEPYKFEDNTAWNELLIFGGKGGGSAPSPDPNIGIAALKNAELGEEWLAWAREQAATSEERQTPIDELSKQVTEQQMATQDLANKWAQEDRDIQEGYRDKYDQWADEDRQTGQDYREQFAGIGQEALDQAARYEDIFGQTAEDQRAQSQEFMDQAREQNEFAREQQQRYRDTFVPVEDRLAEDAMNWDSPERQAEMAAQARADVLNSAQAQQQAQNRQMASMGIDPRSGRAAGIDSATALTTALSSAGAQNQARDLTRQQGVALRGQAAGVGQAAAGLGQNASQIANQTSGLGQQASSLAMQADAAGHSALQQGQNMQLQANNLGLAASGVGNTAASLGMGNQGAGYTGLGTGLSAGSSALGGQLSANQAYNQGQSVMNQGFGGAMQGYQNQANTLNNLYQSQLQGWQAQQQANNNMWGGIGNLVGTGIGAAATIFSSKKVKKDKKKVNGALDAVNDMPVEKWKYKDGVADGGEHIGPYAEDFKKATGLGNGKEINIVDAIGLNMKATQELSDKVDKLNKKRG